MVRQIKRFSTKRDQFLTFLNMLMLHLSTEAMRNKELEMSGPGMWPNDFKSCQDSSGEDCFIK